MSSRQTQTTENPSERTLKRFAGVFVVGGKARRFELEADDLAEATAIAHGWGVGIEGEAAARSPDVCPLPEAYDRKTACRLLGNISRTTLYAELTTGKLDRVPGTRRVLITRRSIEKRCGAQ